MNIPLSGPTFKALVPFGPSREGFPGAQPAETLRAARNELRERDLLLYMCMYLVCVYVYLRVSAVV